MSEKLLRGIIKSPSDTEENWQTHDPIIPEGVIALSHNKNNFKIGNGTSRWNELNYFINSNNIISALGYTPGSSNLSLGETSSTAYRGDRGKIAYDHSQSAHARTDATVVSASSTNGNIKINGTETTVYTHPSGTNPHGTTKSDVGLGNVGNFKAVSTVASQGLTIAEQANARANIGAGTSSFSGSYNDLSNKPTIPTKTSDLQNDSDFVSDANYVHTDNNYSVAEKNKLSGIESGAQVNFDFNNTTSQMLRGTNSNKTTATGLWTDSAWYTNGNVISVSNAPNPDIKYGYSLARWNNIRQKDIAPSDDNYTDYTVSFYAKGTGILNIELMYEEGTAFNPYYMTFSTPFNIESSKWKRYAFTIKKEDSHVNADSTRLGLGIVNNSMEEVTLQICGVKMERGDVATPWCLSQYEIDNANVDLSEIESDIDTLETNQTQILSDVEVVKDTLGYEVVNLAINQSANSIIGYCESGKTYTLSYSGGAKCNLRKNSSSGDVIKSGGESPITFTADSDFGLFFNPFTSSWSNLQLEIGDTATEYTPYVDDVDTRLTSTEHSLSTTSTATGNPISVSDSAHVNAEELKVELEPIQDLHGYDKPWVGGAGKNLLPLTVDEIKSVNTSGAWSGNIYTLNGVTFTILTDTDGNIIGFSANGTSTTSDYVSLRLPNVFLSGSYIINGCPSGGGDTTFLQRIGISASSLYYSLEQGSGITLSNVNDLFDVSLFVKTATNVIFYPMIRLSTETDPTFEPYSNICPISGYDSTSVVRSGKNLFDGVIEEGTINNNTGENASQSGRYRSKNFIPIKSGNTYTASIDGVEKVINYWLYDKNKVGISSASDSRIVAPSSAYYLRFFYDSTILNANIQLELGSTATTFEPYTADTYTLQFGDTVYGAEVDFVSGVMTVINYGKTLTSEDFIGAFNAADGRRIASVATNAKATASNSEIGNVMCSIALAANANNQYNGANKTSVAINISGSVLLSFEGITTDADFRDKLDELTPQLVYELATPYTIQLTPQQIKMLKGNNVLTADGDMDLTYQTDSVVGDVKEWAEEHFIPYNTYRTPPVYGFHIDGNNSDPSSRVTYIADNANYTPAYMDYTADKFRYNSWQNAWFIKYCKPCIMNQDGTVKAYLNPNDYTKDIDGNTVVIDENLTGANVEIEFPKIWYKVVPDAENVAGANVYFSPVKVDEDYKDYAYIDKDGVHKEHFYMPAYNGSVLSGTTVMRSISGQAVSKNLDASTEIAYAKANGDGWFTEDASEIMLINFLLILIGKSTDTQTVFGRGIDSGGETAFNNYVTGAGNLKGLFYGTNTGTGLVKVFGIENWWGLQWRRYAGDVLDNGVRKVKLCYGNEDGSTTFDFNIDGTGYVDVGVTPSGTKGGYIRTMKFTHDGMYSAISDGSSSTYYCDGQWFNNTYHTIYALRGGNSGSGVHCGAFCVDLVDSPEALIWNYGAAVSYK